MQPRVFDEGMNRLVEVFGEVTALKTALYWGSLKDLPDGGFVLAVKEALKRCEFFPKPKHLREFAAPYRLPAIVQAFNRNQVAEFTETQVEDAKRRIKEIAAGLIDEVAIPPKPIVDLSERREALRQQAESLGVAV